MERIAFLIHVKPDKLDEYKRLHNPIPSDLAAELKRAGIRNYTLWLADGGNEFGYLEVDDWAAACAYLEKSPVYNDWQVLMQNYLDSARNDAAGGQPVTMLERVMLLE